MAYRKALRTVYTTEGNLMVVDKETGEVVDSQQWNKKKYRPGAHYLKVFYKNPLFYEPIPNSSRTLLFAMATLLPYADSSPRVTLSKVTIEEITDKFGLSASTIRKSVQDLIARDFIRRVCRGVYEVNPYLYAKGPSSSVLKLQRDWDMETPTEPDTEAPEAKEE